MVVIGDSLPLTTCEPRSAYNANGVTCTIPTRLPLQLIIDLDNCNRDHIKNVGKRAAVQAGCYGPAGPASPDARPSLAELPGEPLEAPTGGPRTIPGRYTAGVDRANGTQLNSLTPGDVIVLDSLLDNEAREKLKNVDIGLFTHGATVRRVVVEGPETSFWVKVILCDKADCGCLTSPLLLFSGLGKSLVKLRFVK